MKKTLALVWTCCVSLLAACEGAPPAEPTGPLDAPSNVANPAESPQSNAITVTGQVLRAPGVPETAALVYIPGKERKAQLVDVQGRFTIPDVTPPYDLIVRMRTGGKTYARVYMGLTLPNPSVRTLSVAATDNSYSSVRFSGKVTGQQSPQGTSRMEVSYTAPFSTDRWDASPPYNGWGTPDATGAYSLYSSASSISEGGSLFSYQYTTNEAGRPKNYVAFGRRDGVYSWVTTGQDVVLNPVTTGAPISLDLTAAPGNLSSSLYLRMNLSPTLGFDLEYTSLVSSALTFAVPELSQTTFQLRGGMSTQDGAYTNWLRSGLKPGDTVKATVPVGVKIITPVSAEKDVPASSTLSWSQVPNALYSHRFACGLSLVYIDQVTPQLVLPDLSAVGMSLKPLETCAWSLEAFAPVRSADEMIGNDYARQRERSFTEAVYNSRDSLSFTLAKESPMVPHTGAPLGEVFPPERPGTSD